jgi:arylsulfatase A-like enzyme
MAAHGVWFRNAISASSWTTTGVSSYLTAQDVDTHQTYNNQTTFVSSLESMAEYLKANGYSTACVQMNGNLLAQHGFNQGFDTYDQMTYDLLEDATTRAIQRMNSMAQPFFLYIHCMATHVDFLAPASYRPIVGYPPPGLSASERTIIENNLVDYYYDNLDYQLGLEPVRTYPELSAAGQEGVHLLYEAGARYTDDQVARLMTAVNARNPNTYTIFTADHGELLFEHGGCLGHALWLYEELLRVPLILRGPGLTPSINDANVSTLDILPTLAAQLGLPARAYWQGQNLFAPRDPDGPTFTYTQGHPPPYSVNLESVRWGQWKLILDRNVGASMLFDVVADPQEGTDLAGQNPDVVRQLKAELDAHRLLDGRTRPAEGSVTPRPSAFVEGGVPVTLSAPPGQEYQWMKDGAYLVEDWPHITDVESRNLVITPATSADLGLYECVYRDTSRRLRITRPFNLSSLLPPDSVPATNKSGLAVLVFLLVTAAAIHTRRLGENSRIRRADKRRGSRG